MNPIVVRIIEVICMETDYEKDSYILDHVSPWQDFNLLTVAKSHP